jgi:hypothetical protein
MDSLGLALFNMGLYLIILGCAIAALHYAKKSFKSQTVMQIHYWTCNDEGGAPYEVVTETKYITTDKQCNVTFLDAQGEEITIPARDIVSIREGI